MQRPLAKLLCTRVDGRPPYYSPLLPACSTSWGRRPLGIFHLWVLRKGASCGCGDLSPQQRSRTICWCLSEPTSINRLSLDHLSVC